MCAGAFDINCMYPLFSVSVHNVSRRAHNANDANAKSLCYLTYVFLYLFILFFREALPAQTLTVESSLVADKKIRQMFELLQPLPVQTSC